MGIDLQVIIERRADDNSFHRSKILSQGLSFFQISQIDVHLLCITAAFFYIADHIGHNIPGGPDHFLNGG